MIPFPRWWFRTRIVCSTLGFLICVNLCSSVALSSARAGDWYRWRGPTDDGVSPEKSLPAKFNVLWKADYGCRSTPIVMNGKVYINGSVGEKENVQERVMCLNADTGEKVWEHRFDVWLTDIVVARVGWTNLVGDPETGNVISHGTQGLLTAFDGKTGKVLWERSLTEEFGRVSGYGGRLSSPIVEGNLVIIGMACANWGEYARGGVRFAAFDKKNGKLVWWGSTGYRVRNTFQSIPTVATINGQRLMIVGSGDGGIHAFKVHTGEKVWTYLIASGAVNPDPVVEGNFVYAAHGGFNPGAGGRQGRVVCLDASQVKNGKPKEVWKLDGLRIKFASPILHGGLLYLNDDGATLHCLDTAKGKKLWSFKFGGGSNNRSSPVLADGKIYVCDADAGFHILKLQPGGKRPTKLLKLRLPSKTPGVDAELDGSPAVANGRVYFSTNDTTFCLGKVAKESEGVGRKGVSVSRGKPAYLRVYPGEVTLTPGGTEKFTARLFDENGNFLREVKPKWSLGPMLAPEATIGLPPPPKINPPALKGEITEDGTLTVPAMLQGQFGAVVAEAEGITGRARVRQVGKLPYKQDFKKVPVKAVPGGWVNTQGKFAVRKQGDVNVLVKLATNPSPLFLYAYAFIGPPSMKNYTIEADVQGTDPGPGLPDMGVSAHRYRLELAGATQQLRLTSWDAVPRVDHTIAYPWKAGQWYRLKLTVSVAGGKALVRGKVWLRGAAEPAGWNVQINDPSPVREGSPALYGHAIAAPGGGAGGSEIFYANVAITPNKK